MNPESDTLYGIISNAGLRPTANRVAVLKCIHDSSTPLSLSDICRRLTEMDKSSVFRTLSALQEAHLVHSMEDGRGIELFESCTCKGEDDTHKEIHPHFYCTCCKKVYCLESQTTPSVSLPDGFTANSVNYMVKGICADCRFHSAGHLHRN